MKRLAVILASKEADNLLWYLIGCSMFAPPGFWKWAALGFWSARALFLLVWWRFWDLP